MTTIIIHQDSHHFFILHFSSYTDNTKNICILGIILKTIEKYGLLVIIIRRDLQCSKLLDKDTQSIEVIFQGFILNSQFIKLFKEEIGTIKILSK